MPWELLEQPKVEWKLGATVAVYPFGPATVVGLPFGKLNDESPIYVVRVQDATASKWLKLNGYSDDGLISAKETWPDGSFFSKVVAFFYTLEELANDPANT